MYTTSNQSFAPGSKGSEHGGASLGRFMSPDPSGLAYADPTNPQSFNLYSYAWNNPLTNIDPDGLDCAKDNGDGTVGYNSGDCGNENEDAANHEYYINCDGCTSGAAGAHLDAATGDLYATDANGNGISGTTVSGFADPQGTPGTNVTVNGSAPYLDTISGFGILPDIDSQRIQQLALGVVNFGIPNVCGFGINARVGRGRVTLGADLSTNKGLHGAAGVRVAQLGNVQGGVSIKGGNVSATVNVRIPDTPFSVGAGTNGSRITSANVSARYGVLNLQGYAAISNFGDPNCH
jgi:hypothetical protein